MMELLVNGGVRSEMLFLLSLCLCYTHPIFFFLLFLSFLFLLYLFYLFLIVVIHLFQFLLLHITGSEKLCNVNPKNKLISVKEPPNSGFVTEGGL